jgi:hypothetical protein
MDWILRKSEHIVTDTENGGSAAAERNIPMTTAKIFEVGSEATLSFIVGWKDLPCDANYSRTPPGNRELCSLWPINASDNCDAWRLWRERNTKPAKSFAECSRLYR